VALIYFIDQSMGVVNISYWQAMFFSIFFEHDV